MTQTDQFAAPLCFRGPRTIPGPQPVSYVLLDERSEGQVTVRQKNRDLFFLSLGEAVAVCANFAKCKADFTNEVTDLLEKLSGWVTVRRDKIGSAHLTFRRDGSILFLVIQKAVEFDEPLSDELTDLDIEIAMDPAFGLINFDVLAIPAVSTESANAFLSSGEVYTHA